MIHAFKMAVIVRLRLLLLLCLCQAAHFIATPRAIIDILRGRYDRASEVLDAYDRLGNAASGGLSTEMITYRAARGRTEKIRNWCVLCRWLDRVDPGHCDRARP